MKKHWIKSVAINLAFLLDAFPLDGETCFLFYLVKI